LAPLLRLAGRFSAGDAASFSTATETDPHSGITPRRRESKLRALELPLEPAARKASHRKSRSSLIRRRGLEFKQGPRLLRASCLPFCAGLAPHRRVSKLTASGNSRLCTVSAQRFMTRSSLIRGCDLEFKLGNRSLSVLHLPFCAGHGTSGGFLISSFLQGAQAC